jgi:hypothetical protein
MPVQSIHLPWSAAALLSKLSANIQLLQEFGPISKGNLPLHLTGYFSVRRLIAHVSVSPRWLTCRAICPRCRSIGLGGQYFVYNADLNARRRSLRHHFSFFEHIFT